LKKIPVLWFLSEKSPMILNTKKKKNFHFLFFSSSWKNVILLFFFTLCTWRQQTHPVFRILTPCFVWNSLKSIESSEYQGKVNKMKAWASSHSIFKLSFRCFREINQAKKVDRQEVSVVCWTRAFSAGQFTQCTTRTSRTILDHSLSWSRAQIAGHFFFIMKVRSLESKRNRAGKRGVREWIFLRFFFPLKELQSVDIMNIGITNNLCYRVEIKITFFPKITASTVVPQHRLSNFPEISVKPQGGQDLCILKAPPAKK